jgi:CubicO group peptidase (beta-lactamase class C family)
MIVLFAERDGREDVTMDDRTTRKIDALIVEAMEAEGVPGVAVAITEGGELTYARGHGVMNVETKVAVTPQTLFHLASITKTFVGTAILRLAERGRLDLHAPVVAYLPYFRLHDERYTQITIAQMLSHTSGMPDTDEYDWDRPEYDDGALERYVRGLEGLSLLAPPGERFAYSNIAFEVLGDVIAKVSGISFEEYVRRELLLPLGMARSTLLVREADPALLASPHVRAASGDVVVSDVFPYNRAHAPSSTMYSNVLELSRWAMAHLNRGEFGGARILTSQTYDLTWRSWAATRDGYWQEIGLSWFLGERSGERCVAHEGADVGFKACFILAPARGVSAIGLGNLDMMKNEDLTDAILDVVLTGGAGS